MSNDKSDLLAVGDNLYDVAGDLDAIAAILFDFAELASKNNEYDNRIVVKNTELYFLSKCLRRLSKEVTNAYERIGE